MALTSTLRILEKRETGIMEITIDTRYEQLLAAIKKLPAAKIKQLKSVLDDDFIREKASGELSDFQNF